MLYFFYGGNDFLAVKEVEKMKQTFIRKNHLINWGFFDLREDQELEKFLEKIVSGGGFFAKQTFLVAENFFNLKSVAEKKILLALKKRNSRDEIIFLHKSDKLIKGKILDYLEKKAKKKQFSLLNFQQILDWTIKEVKERSGGKVFLGKEAAARLVFLAEENLWKIDQEINKLINFVGDGAIEKRIIDFFLENRQVNGAFDLVEALGRRDKKYAMSCLLNMLKNREDGFLILGSIIGLLRNLIKIYSSIKSGKNINSPETQKTLKVHSFVIQKTLQQLSFFSFRELKERYFLAIRLEEEIKLGQRKIEDALIELVARF